MPHERPQRTHQRPVARSSHGSQPQQGTASNTISALDAKLKLVAQRIKIVENNVQVMSRTMVSHNKKLKDLETAVAAGGGGKVDVDAIKKAMREEFEQKLSDQQASGPLEIHDYSAGSAPAAKVAGAAPEEVRELRKELAELRKQVEEMKYVVDTLNPMEYVTLDDINDVIDRKISTKLE